MDECPYCETELDHSEPREWHSMNYGDEIIVPCDNCGERIKICADICWSVEKPGEGE